MCSSLYGTDSTTLSAIPILLLYYSMFHFYSLAVFCVFPLALSVRLYIAFVPFLLCSVSCTELGRQVQAVQTHSAFPEQKHQRLNVYLNVISALLLPGRSAVFISIISLCCNNRLLGLLANTSIRINFILDNCAGHSLVTTPSTHAGSAVPFI